MQKFKNATMRFVSNYRIFYLHHTSENSVKNHPDSGIPDPDFFFKVYPYPHCVKDADK